MRYIGSKRYLIDEIAALIDKKENDSGVRVATGDLVLLDLFAGTNVVAQSLKPKYKVISNDIMYFSHVIARGHVAINRIPDFRKLEQAIDSEVLMYLNALGGVENAGFIANNYSPLGSERMYFTEANACKIDHIRSTIEYWRDKYLDDDAYFYLLACLIEAVPFVSNTSGIYGAYLKKWDKRAFLDLTLKHPIIYNNGHANSAHQSDANRLVKEVVADICYIDPPYNGRQYTSNYHLLDTIAYGDEPDIAGKTGMRFYTPDEKSLYCSKVNVYEQFENLINDVQSEHIFVSYSSDGTMGKEYILATLKKHCDPNSVALKKINYRKYKSKIVRGDNDVEEYLFYGRKPKWFGKIATPSKDDHVDTCLAASVIKRSDGLLASPLNYVGGKYKLLPQLLPHFPDDINEFVDMFAGGLNVGINVECQKLVANDLNHFVIELLEALGSSDIDILLSDIQGYIQKYGLSKTNEAGFLQLRHDFNANPTPIGLYALMCHSYNYQLRFNNNLGYNNPFGKDRSFFSPNLRRKLILFNQRLSQTNVAFYSLPFEELVLQLEVSREALFYCDPPYLLSTGSYNDGNRGFKDWGGGQEDKLHTVLDTLNDNGHRFVMSNVIEHKGFKNERLIDWAKKYEMVHLDFNYNNASHNSKKGGQNKTQEVIIKNF